MLFPRSCSGSAVSLRVSSRQSHTLDINCNGANSSVGHSPKFFIYSAFGDPNAIARSPDHSDCNRTDRHENNLTNLASLIDLTLGIECSPLVMLGNQSRGVCLLTQTMIDGLPRTCRCVLGFLVGHFNFSQVDLVRALIWRDGIIYSNMTL